MCFREEWNCTNGIVKLFVELQCIAEIVEGKDTEGTETWGGSTVMRPVSLRLSRSTPGICSAKWRGIPWHANDAFVVGNVQRWGAISRKKALGVLS